MSGNTEYNTTPIQFFEFIFCGTQKQYDFFIQFVKKRLPNVEIQSEERTNLGDRICRIEENANTIFLIGFILAGCYSAFNDEKNT